MPELEDLVTAADERWLAAIRVVLSEPKKADEPPRQVVSADKYGELLQEHDRLWRHNQSLQWHNDVLSDQVAKRRALAAATLRRWRLIFAPSVLAAILIGYAGGWWLASK